MRSGEYQSLSLSPQILDLGALLGAVLGAQILIPMACSSIRSRSARRGGDGKRALGGRLSL